MKSCKDFELMILNQETSKALDTHVANCPDCKTFQALVQHSPTTFLMDDITIQKEVSQAIEKADHIQKKQDALSLIAFILFALVFTSLAATALLSFTENTLRVYWFFVSGVMPFTLPAISIIKRKVAMR